LDILTDTEVVSMWPKFLFCLDCKQCCTVCILNFVLNMAPHCLHPYYEMVVLRMQDSLPFENEVQSNPVKMTLVYARTHL